MPNTEIAKDMTPVLDQLKQEKPVFLITYGASGAGKTSTLIYLRYTDSEGKVQTQQGVLVELCNSLGVDGYHSANVTVNEYFKSNTKEDTHSSENEHTGMCHKNNEGILTCSRKEYKFEYESNSKSFMLTEPNEITPTMHQYRTQQKKSTFKKSESSMAEVISYLVDTDRLVHATTNNPQSSRSHCVVYITLVNGEGKRANLFVADLAGVENTFECSSGKTIMDFMNIANSQGFKTEDNALIPYYSLSGSVLSEKSGGEDSTKTSLHPVFNELPEKDPLLYSKQNTAALAKLFDFNDMIESINSIPKWKESFKASGKNVNIDMLKKMIHQLLGIKKDVNYTTSMEYYEYMLNMDNDALNNNHGKYYNEIVDYGDDSDKLQEDVQKIITFLQYDKDETSRKHNYGYLFESNNVKDVAITLSDATIKEAVVDKLNEDTNIIISKEEGNEAINEILRFNSGSKRIVEKRTFTKQTSGVDQNYRGVVNNGKDINPYTLTQILRDLKKEEIKGEDKINIYDEILKMEKLRNPNKQERLISNDDYRTLYDLLYEILHLNMERIKYGKEVCENRREEGYFINSSLKLIRDTVNEILIEKGKDVLLQAPDIISDCLKDYCPTLSNCFQLTPVMNKKTEYSIIFDDVYKYLRNETPDNYNKTRFYKEVLVCVFCVLNISRKANDPPLVSYLDMNDLKKKYYSTNASIDNIKTNVSDLINKIETYNSKVEDEHGLVDVIQKDLDELKKFNETTTNDSDNQAKSTYKEALEKVMTQVDNSNAVSAMGTLIFTDKIAKLNTTDTVCQPTLDDTITKSYKPLYEVGKEEPVKEEVKKEVKKEESPVILKNRQRNHNKSKKGHVYGRPGKHRGTRGRIR